MFTTDERRRHNPKPRPKYKFDKQLINVNVTTNNSITSTTIYTCIFPCVVMGIIVDGSSSTLTANTSSYAWAMVVVEQGTTLSVIALAGTLYAPEQQVLAFGSGVVTNGDSQQFHTKTKTGRKLRAGDTIQFTIISSTAATLTSHCYTIQFFLKI